MEENVTNIQDIKRKNIRTKPGMDYNLIAIVFVLCAVGLIMVYSTSYYTAKQTFDNDLYYFNKQLIATIIGLIAMFITAKVINVRRLNNSFLIVLAIIISLGLMMLVRTPLGVEAYGARRWIQVPVIGSIQPSEFAKISMILFVAWYLSKNTTDNSKVWTFFKVEIMAVLMAIYIWLVTDHLSAGIIVVLISTILAFLANKNTKFLSTFIIANFVAGFVGLRYLSMYVLNSSDNFRFNRILVWSDPTKYMESGGYQIIQGLYAIGSGGFFGRGFGKSTQKLGFIPEAQNDMIIAILCEELGVIGIIVLLLMFSYLLYRLFIIASACDDLFSFLVVAGIFSHIAIQVILNLCVILNLIPTTGITMPFISYGGSSIVILLVEIGFALGLSNRLKKKAFKLENR